MQPPRLAIIIVTASGMMDLTRACLESVQRSVMTDATVEVHLVDNASVEGIGPTLAAEFSWVVLHRLPINVGFSRGNNVALYALREPDYILLLNPDTEVDEGTVAHLIGVLEDNDNAGMVGCHLRQRDGSFDHAAKRGLPTPTSALGYFTGIGRLCGSRFPRLASYTAPDVDEHGLGEVGAINGAFMLMKARALAQVGVLDEQFWMYGEDLDLCLRFREAGWRVLYDGSVSTLHVKGGGSVAKSGKRRRRGVRTTIAFHVAMIRFYRKHWGGGSRLIRGAVSAAVLCRMVWELRPGPGMLPRRHKGSVVDVDGWQEAVRPTFVLVRERRNSVSSAGGAGRRPGERGGSYVG